MTESSGSDQGTATVAVFAGERERRPLVVAELIGGFGGSSAGAKGLLIAAATVNGFVMLSFEIVTLRALAPFFGSSVLTTSSTIAVVLLSLVGGYVQGGRWSRQHASKDRIWLAMLIAAVWYMAAIAAAPHIVKLSGWVPTLAAPAVSAMVISAVPTFLMATVSPLSIAHLARAGERGRVAGVVAALSTIGNLSGVFATVQFLLPKFGVRGAATAGCAGLLLMALGGFGRRRVVLVLVAALGLVAVYFGTRGPPDARVLFETESLYGNVQVRSLRPPLLTLRIDDADGQSVYNPATRFEDSYRGALMVLPVLTPRLSRMLLLGMGGGTVAAAWSELFPARIDAVEIDAAVVHAARRFFHLDGGERLRVFTEDARRFVKRSRDRYDFVALDLYHGANIPLHTATVEFFCELADHLAEGGVVAMNVAMPWEPTVRGLGRSISACFPSVFMVRATFSNAIIFASKTPSELSVVRKRLHDAQQAAFSRDPLQKVSARLARDTLVYRADARDEVFTDDRSTFELLWLAARRRFAVDEERLDSLLPLVTEELKAWPNQEVVLVAAANLAFRTGRDADAMALMERMLQRSETPLALHDWLYSGQTG